ncbi:hypothetical protein TELCIR_25669 [Teladorsagia circumcincta]|uniref:Uncharacterized protein n=1 Tax=Teladorsagia circumcincta TaxID=45464 RepID=A0A2G9T4X6_TELCI|nr:hypothetical protein TELCIR_25669 [Teladorsagia circumcincta]
MKDTMEVGRDEYATIRRISKGSYTAIAPIGLQCLPLFVGLYFSL